MVASQGEKQASGAWCDGLYAIGAKSSAEAFILSSILHQNNRPNTSNLWLLTFFPFLFHTIFGRGSPVAWQMKDATPPCTPIWSLGVLKNFGGAEEGQTQRKQITKIVSEEAKHPRQSN